MNLHLERNSRGLLFGHTPETSQFAALLNPLFSPAVRITELQNGAIPHELWEKPRFVQEYFTQLNALNDPLEIEKIMRLVKPQYSIQTPWTPEIANVVIPACITADRYPFINRHPVDDNMRFNTLITTLHYALSRYPRLAPDADALKTLVEPHIAKIPSIPLEPSMDMIQKRVFEGLPIKKQSPSVFGFVTTIFH